MAYYLLITYKGDNGKDESFDVSSLAHNIEFTTSLESQPGKLSFHLEKDPNEILKINIGSEVRFFKDSKAIFFGKVFTIETDATDVYRVVAYDNLRYLKNKDSILIDGTDSSMTLTKMFTKIMNSCGFKYEIGGWTKEVKLVPLEEHNFWNVSLFDILDYCMSEEEMRQGVSAPYQAKLATNTSNKLYRRFYLKSNCEKIELREIYYDFLYDENGKEKDSFLMIGDESLLNNYDYKVDIDQDTYNRFIFVVNSEKTDSDEYETAVIENNEIKQLVAGIDSGTVISNTNTTLDGKKIGEETISKWGVLSTIIELKSIEPTNKLEEYMRNVVEIYSIPRKTLKLNAIGYDGVIAGSAFFLYLSKLGVHYPVYVLSATHRYDSNEHTMELEVCTNVSMRKFL